MEVHLPFLLCFTLYLRVMFQVQAPGGAYIWRCDLTEGFLCYRFGGLIFGGAYTWRGLFLEFYGIYFGVNFCESLFLRITGKIAKNRTCQNFVPHGIFNFHFSQLRSFFKKKLTMRST